MANTYYAINNNVCVINFAYKKDDVTYYSDLIKVGVSMDNGKIVSLEAQGYLTNHIKRKALTASLQKSKRKANYQKILKL